MVASCRVMTVARACCAESMSAAVTSPSPRSSANALATVEATSFKIKVSQWRYLRVSVSCAMDNSNSVNALIPRSISSPLHGWIKASWNVFKLNTSEINRG